MFKVPSTELKTGNRELETKVETTKIK